MSLGKRKSSESGETQASQLAPKRSLGGGKEFVCVETVLSVLNHSHSGNGNEGSLKLNLSRKNIILNIY